MQIDFLFFAAVFGDQSTFKKIARRASTPSKQKSRTPLSSKIPVAILKEREGVLSRDMGKLHNVV
jgi:hypothetical protein